MKWFLFIYFPYSVFARLASSDFHACMCLNVHLNMSCVLLCVVDVTLVYIAYRTDGGVPMIIVQGR